MEVTGQLYALASLPLWGKSPNFPLNERLGRPRAKKVNINISLLVPEINSKHPCSSSLQHSLHTNEAIPALKKIFSTLHEVFLLIILYHYHHHLQC